MSYRSIRNKKTRALHIYEQEMYKSIMVCKTVPDLDSFDIMNESLTLVDRMAEEQKQALPSFERYKYYMSLCKDLIVSRHATHNLVIKLDDVKCLADGTMLNDEVMNFYMALIQDRMNLKSKNILMMITYFWTKMATRPDPERPPRSLRLIFTPVTAETYNKVSKWTKPTHLKKKGLQNIQDIFELELMILPIHWEPIHWAIGCIDFTNQIMHYLDSIPSWRRASRYFDGIAKYLECEYKDKEVSGRTQVALNMAGWKRINHSTIWSFQGDDALYQQYTTHISDRLNVLAIGQNIPTTREGESYVIYKTSQYQGFEENIQTKTVRKVAVYARQTGGTDCGVFACKAGEWLADSIYPDFEQTNIANFRRRMLADIILDKILD
eukprot:95838_1